MSVSFVPGDPIAADWDANGVTRQVLIIGAYRYNGSGYDLVVCHEDGSLGMILPADVRLHWRFEDGQWFDVEASGGRTEAPQEDS